MIKQEIIDLILQGEETQHLELRPSFNWQDSEGRGSLLRSILAMSQTRDGGLIILGVEGRGETYKPVGMKPADKVSFNEKEMISFAEEFSNPPVSFKLLELSLEGSDFLVIEVRPFREAPIICLKDGPGGLKRGALFIRTPDNLESHAAESSAEIRKLWLWSLEKAVQRVRLNMVRDPSSSAISGKSSLEEEQKKFELPRKAVPMDAETRQKFDAQLDFEKGDNPDLEKIRAKGYWRVIIRPTKFEQRFAAPEAGLDAVRDAAVRIRGGGFPSSPARETSIIKDWVQCGQSFLSSVYYWRFFQSGQFVYYAACREDYEVDPKKLSEFNIPDVFPTGRYLDVISALYLVTEIYQFASRLTFAGILAPFAEISIHLFNAQERQLFCWDPVWGSNEICICQDPDIAFTRTYLQDELLNGAPELAVQACQSVFSHFNGRLVADNILQLKQKQFLKLEL